MSSFVFSLLLHLMALRAFVSCVVVQVHTYTVSQGETIKRTFLPGPNFFLFQAAHWKRLHV